ncbi:MAG: biopolymer transporter ExbD [Rikenellaceae bacterium]|nr:biopolymer transporter ExbD [Rikenellaceae bacterium]
MAIKRGSKVETSFGSASMTDLMFLLIIFFMVAMTMVNTNALQIMLPKGASRVDDKPTTTVTVTDKLEYFIDGNPINYEQLEPMLKERFAGVEKPVVMVSMDKHVQVDEFAKLMNMAKRGGFSLFMMTTP